MFRAYISIRRQDIHLVLAWSRTIIPEYEEISLLLQVLNVLYLDEGAFA